MAWSVYLVSQHPEVESMFDSLTQYNGGVYA